MTSQAVEGEEVEALETLTPRKEEETLITEEEGIIMGEVKALTVMGAQWEEGTDEEEEGEGDTEIMTGTCLYFEILS